MDVCQPFGVGIARHHNVRFFGQQCFKSVEKLFLCTVFIGKKLHIINQQQVQRVVILLELIKGFALIGLDHIRNKLLGMDIQHLGVRSVNQQLVAYGVHQMSFTQTHAAVNK